MKRNYPKLIILSGRPLRYDYLYSEKMLNEMRTLALYHSRYETRIEIQPWGELVWARGATALAHTLLTKTVIAEGRQKLRWLLCGQPALRFCPQEQDRVLHDAGGMCGEEESRRQRSARLVARRPHVRRH